MPSLVAVQLRDYRLHRLEVEDRGRAGFTITIYPPANRGGQPREVKPGVPGMTLADALNQAKAEIDAVMGPKPAPKPRPFARPQY